MTTPSDHSSTSPEQLHIVTLNCWGLKYISTHRAARLSRIGEELATASPRPDIVGLQECWTQTDYESIRASTRAILPYGKFYHSGIFGGGLVILSRFPIESSSMVRYPLNGRPAAFYRGDWFVGKGVACATLRIGPSAKDLVEVFCTHLHAPYEAEPHDSYLCHRTAQAWEAAKLVRGARERGHLVVAMGDFNMVPGSMAHAIIELHGGVKDAWQAVHSENPAHDTAGGKVGNVLVSSAEDCVARYGVTCDSAYNTWTWNKAQQKLLAAGKDSEVDGTAPDVRAKRLDYVFVGAEPDTAASAWRVGSVRVGMMTRHPQLRCSLSDHFAVEATVIRDSVSESGPDPSPLTTSARPHLPLKTYDDILGMIATYTRREEKQRRLRLSHFGIQLTVAIACLVASWFSPRPFVNFLLMLVSTLGLSAGVVDGLMGGLFVGSELRALKEFSWEISNARSMAAVSSSPSS